ncbi:MAG: alcohol dehydrogenase catalytic domain-containing protein, partial [Bryobacteraceae bacterium]
MRSVSVDYEQRRLAQREIADPVRRLATEVLFRVHEVGICGTDRDLARFRLGHAPKGESHLVLGHEALGQVVETGAAVSELAPGDWVVPTVRRACPGCASCARGRRDLCLTGQYTERGIWRSHGYFTEYAVDDAADLLRVPPASIDCAILIEPMSVVEKAIERAFETHPGEPACALVLGAGPIGILAALALRERKLTVDLFSVEPRDHPRIKLLEEAGVRYRERLGEARADLVIEAAGSAELAFQAIHALAPLG